MLPAVIDPDTPSPGELSLFRRLERDPGTADWVVLHSLELPNHVSQVRGELDFLVLIPELGFLCVEVKAHREVRRDENGMWHLGHQRPTGKSPFQQASKNMYSVLELLRQSRVDMDRVPMSFLVAFTDARFSAPEMEWHPWEVVDLVRLQRESIAAVCRRSLSLARRHMGRDSSPGPSREDCDRVAAFLRPMCETATTRKDRREGHAAEVTTFTKLQFRALDAMDPNLNPRVIFEGPAGTGKTFLALEAARRAVFRGDRVLVVCFNRLLGHWLHEQLQDFGASVDAGTLARFMRRSIGATTPGASTSPDYWRRSLPLAAADALLARSDGATFDTLIVDEAQDLLHQEWLDVLDLALVGGLSAGSWLMFGDFAKQAIYESSDIPLEEFSVSRGSPPIYSLRENCRNTRVIAGLASSLGGLTPGYDSVLRPSLGDPPQYRFYGDSAEQQALLAQVLDALASDGFAGEDVVVLSPVTKGAVNQLPNPWRQRLRPAGDHPYRGYVRFATIHAFKGLEARAVILTDIEQVQGEKAEALFYTGLTRATERLIVLADKRVREDLIARAEAGLSA